MPSKEELIKRYGSEEAVSAHYREMQIASRKTYRGTGGLRSLKQSDPEKFLEHQRKAAKARWSKDVTDS